MCFYYMYRSENIRLIFFIFKETVSIGSRPQLRVLEAHGEDYTLILSDTLTLRGYQEYRCNDYHLGKY